MTRKSFRSLLAADGPLVLLGTHDAVGARFGVPDIGLKSLGDLSQTVHTYLSVVGFGEWTRIEASYRAGKPGPDQAGQASIDAVQYARSLLQIK